MNLEELKDVAVAVRKMMLQAYVDDPECALWDDLTAASTHMGNALGRLVLREAVAVKGPVQR